MKKQKSIPAVKKEIVLNKKLKYGMLLVFGVYLFLLTSYKAAGDDDMFWHLSTGRYIAETKSVPSADVFGYITEGNPWIPIEWAWDTVTYLIYSAFSYEGLSVLRSIIVLAMFFVLYLTLKRLKLPASVIVVSLFILSIGLFERYSIRPHLVSYLFTAIVLYIIVRLRYTAKPEGRLLYYFPPIFFVWVNFHQGVYFGLLLFAIYIIYEASGIYLLKKRRTEFPKDKLFIKILFAFFAVSVICLLLTPHTVDTIIYTYNHASMKMLQSINEWKSPFEPMFASELNIVFYKIFLFAGVIVLIQSIRKKVYFTAIVTVIFGIISTTGIRFITDYEIISSVFIFSSIYFLFTGRKYKQIQAAILSKPVTVYVIIALLAVVSYTIPNGKMYSGFFKEYKVFGLGIDRDFYPIKMFEFAKENNINETGSRVFNHYGVGGMFSWYFGPAQKNFIDSRNLSDEIFYMYDSLDYIKGNYEAKLRELGIDYVMYYVPVLFQRPEVMNQILVAHLSAKTDDWKLVYWDDISFIFVKNNAAFAEIIKKYEYKYLTPYNFGYRRQLITDAMKSDRELYNKELQRKLSEEPGGMIINTMAGTLR